MPSPKPVRIRVFLAHVYYIHVHHIHEYIYMYLHKHELRIVHTRIIYALNSTFSVRWPKFRRLSLPKCFGQMLTSPPGRPFPLIIINAASSLPSASSTTPLELIVHKIPVYPFSGLNPMHHAQHPPSDRHHRARLLRRNKHSEPREFIGYGPWSRDGGGEGWTSEGRCLG